MAMVEKDTWIDEMREAWEPYWPLISAAVGLLVIAALLSGCAYLDAAHAIKEEGKARAAILNDHYAADVADLVRTIPAGALARMPAGERKCALAELAGLRLIDCYIPRRLTGVRDGAGD